jgi:flagellar basal-body rod protein FlgG
MSNSLFQILNISKQDMQSRLIDLDTASHNLANVNTNGYKAQRSNFQELLEKQQLSGTMIRSTQIMPEQGTARVTDSPLDLMVQGDGYFAVKLPGNQTGYTRNGSFNKDASGAIVDGDGHQLVWSGTIPADAQEVMVQKDGTVFARVGTTWSQAGTIQLSRFTNPTGMDAYGENIYTETLNSGKAQTAAPGSTNMGVIASKQLEQSNVNVADEMAHLVTLQRSFQMSVRTFQQTDTMITEAIHMRKG